MKVYFDIIQQTVEWFEIRYRKIGGTRSKGLLTKSDTLLIEMLSEFTEDFDEDSVLDGFVSDAMERGNEYEHQARIELSKYTGIDFKPVGWIQSDNKLLGISADGVSDCLKFACEIKCPGSKKHVATCLNDEIPLDHIHQCVHYFAVNPKLEKLFFMSYRPESIKPMFVKEISRDSIVNIGTKAKPVFEKVSDVVETIKTEALLIHGKINAAIEKLIF